MRDLLTLWSIYWPSLTGGGLIGISAVWLLATEGRVAGISSITGSLLRRPDRETPWRMAFLVGLIGGPMVLQTLSGQPPRVRILATLPVLALAGLLVGFGTRLGSGCTSGHGVCGLARMSIRSIAAVATFVATGAATVFLVRHGIAGDNL
jgi:uncharacterized membrane protein YedE/YeeE